MITDPCTCGIKPEGHAHVVNKKDEVIFWKGIPIDKDVDTWKKGLSATEVSKLYNKEVKNNAI